MLSAAVQDRARRPLRCHEARDRSARHRPPTSHCCRCRILRAAKPCRMRCAASGQRTGAWSGRSIEHQLAVLKRDGRLRDHCPYPIRVWRFGLAGQLVIALAGEPVVDYSLRFRAAYGWDRTWVAGYNHVLLAYIPSGRILAEGGLRGHHRHAGVRPAGTVRGVGGVGHRPLGGPPGDAVVLRIVSGGNGMRIQLERCAVVTATPHTTWTFAVLGDGEGTATTVEVTSGRSMQVIDALAGMVESLHPTGVTGEGQIEELLCLTQDRLREDGVLATAVSALRSAAVQLEAARAGMSLHCFLGAASTDSVELYANINRGLRATDRTPDAFERAPPRGPRGRGSGPSSARRSTRCHRRWRRTACSVRPFPAWSECGRYAARSAPARACWSIVTAASRRRRRPPSRASSRRSTWAGSRSRCSRHRRPPTWPRSPAR